MEYKLSYDYTDMIQELKEELEDKILKPDSIIQILRDTQTHSEYSPIIDWYYSDDKVIEDTKIEFDDTDKDKEFKREYIDRYKGDKPFLKQATVTAVLTEMEDMNRIC